MIVNGTAALSSVLKAKGRKLHECGLRFIDISLKSILLYVHFYFCLRYYVYTALLQSHSEDSGGSIAILD